MRRIILFVTLLAVALMARGQTGYTYRYWFDNDVATQQMGTAIGVSHLNIDASGIDHHQMHALRMQVCNSSGVWSSVRTTYFLLASEPSVATSARYWLDNDEKSAKATPIVNGVIDLDLSGLMTGMHAVRYQTFDANGLASSVSTRYFLLTDYDKERLTCEIWFDNDKENIKTYAVTGEDITLKVSDLSIGSHSVTAVLYDGAGIMVGRDTQTFEVEGGKDYITLNSFGMGTYSSASDLDFSNLPGLKAFIASGYDVEKEAILLTRVYKVPAGTGLILMGQADRHYEVKQSDIRFVYSNMLKGVTANQTIPQSSENYSHFIMREGTDGSEFYPLTESTEMPEGSVYLAIPSSVLPKSGVVKMIISGCPKGDVNDDGKVTITDAVSVVNIILNQSGSPLQLDKGKQEERIEVIAPE